MLLLSADFFQFFFSKKFFQEHYQSVKQLGSRSGPKFFFYLGLNCLQKWKKKQMSKVASSKVRVKECDLIYLSYNFFFFLASLPCWKFEPSKKSETCRKLTTRNSHGDQVLLMLWYHTCILPGRDKLCHDLLSHDHLSHWSKNHYQNVI